MSVSILYYKVTQERISSVQQSELINTWITELPAQKQLKIRKLRQIKDQFLSLAGLQLLKNGLSELSGTAFSLQQLQFPENSKPCCEGRFDFNISHSGDIACCIISDSIKVGIDIECHRYVSAPTLKKFLSDSRYSEYLDHHRTENEQQQFFNLWTINEAVIKAANYGSIFNMHEVKLGQYSAQYQDHPWYYYPVKIVSAEDNNEYTCHIACSEQISDSELFNPLAKQIFKL